MFEMTRAAPLPTRNAARQRPGERGEDKAWWEAYLAAMTGLLASHPHTVVSLVRVDAESHAAEALAARRQRMEGEGE